MGQRNLSKEKNTEECNQLNPECGINGLVFFNKDIVMNKKGEGGS
jgi:hypothetical protein